MGRRIDEDVLLDSLKDEEFYTKSDIKAYLLRVVPTAQSDSFWLRYQGKIRCAHCFSTFDNVQVMLPKYCSSCGYLMSNLYDLQDNDDPNWDWG